MTAQVDVDAFRHEALFYSDEAGFVAEAASFLRDAVAAGEPSLVVVSERKIGLLREALGRDADSLKFADMADVGANPARIIPAWKAFVAEHGGSRLRGIGEPIWKGRSPDELIECQRHESLLNVAFSGADAWWLLCPYDTSALDESVLAEAHRSHPFVYDNSGRRESGDYRGLAMESAPFEVPLPEPLVRPAEYSFGPGPLSGLRRFVARLARSANFTSAKTADLVLAVHEVATNSLLHGGGRGTLRIWRDSDRLVCEVRDSGRIDRPLAGRERPTADPKAARGLWLVNHLCDLVQVRTLSTGSVVRLHLRND